MPYFIDYCISTTKTIVCSLVLSRLDYCNSILSWSSKCLIKKLQKVQNAAARITYYSSSQNVTMVSHPVELLTKLTLCHTSLTTSYPKYLSQLNSVYTCKTTSFIIRHEHPQCWYNKDQVIWSANICIPGTQPLEQSPWWSSKNRGHVCL